MARLWKRRGDGQEEAARRAGEDQAARRLLAAAAARTDEIPDLSPFFMTRVRARLAETRARAARMSPLGLAARQMLPVLVSLAVVVSGWAGVEHRLVKRGPVSTQTTAADSEVAAQELALAIFILAPGAPAAPEGSP